MQAIRARRVGWVAGVAWAVLAGIPATADAQFPVPVAVPTGTNTYNNVIPPTVQLPPPPPASANPLGLPPGFYSFNLGQCLGSSSSSICSGAFLTHAGNLTSTVGVPEVYNPLDGLGQSIGELFGGSVEDDIPAVPATTMPGWSLFAMNVGSTQQALSVADFASTIEMPLGQSFPNSNALFPDWRSHFFSRSADYSELRVGYPLIVNTQSNPPFQRLISLQLSAAPVSDRVFWETSFVTGASFVWATGMGTVTPDDVTFAFGAPPPPLTDAEKLTRLLASINRHLTNTEPEPDAARQLWLSLNPLGMVAHTDWHVIAQRITRELPLLAPNDRSSLLSPDGTFALPVRSNLDQFVLPEPTTVPEPSSWALMASGLLGLAALRRRRRVRGHG